MDILITSRITRECGHRKCALKTVALIILREIAEREYLQGEFEDEDEMIPEKHLSIDYKGQIIEVEFS